jgi:hypothetical protein
MRLGYPDAPARAVPRRRTGEVLVVPPFPDGSAAPDDSGSEDQLG